MTKHRSANHLLVILWVLLWVLAFSAIFLVTLVTYALLNPIKDEPVTEIDTTSKFDKVLNYDEGTLEINEGGTYVVSGTTRNGSVVINTDDEVTITLRNAKLINDFGPAILNNSTSGKTNIVLPAGTDNYLAGGIFTDAYSAVIYSKSDLTITGTGSLWLQAREGEAIITANGILNYTGDGISSNVPLTKQETPVEAPLDEYLE